VWRVVPRDVGFLGVQEGGSHLLIAAGFFTMAGVFIGESGENGIFAAFEISLGTRVGDLCDRKVSAVGSAKLQNIWLS
jgi:hypothetical protein